MSSDASPPDLRGHELRFACVLLAAACFGCTALAPWSGPRGSSLGGRLLAKDGALSVSELSRAVVYLEPIDTPPAPVRRATFRLHHSGARLRPNLVAVAPGDDVWFMNDDSIFHGAFSYSRPNAFDLGVYGPGAGRKARFTRLGAVSVHCPIHSGEVGVVYVAPTRLIARPSPRGGYRLPAAPPGRYRLRVWADGFEAVAHDVTLGTGEQTVRDVVLVPAAG
jgi:plastocyanin